MDSLLTPLKNFINPKKANIADVCFQLHYRATVIILLSCCALNTAKSFFGDPIDCISKDDFGDGDKKNKILDTYCWVHTTFSMEKAWFKRVGVDVPYPGVDQALPNDEITHHAYYQWVCLVLFFQAIFFYLPWYFWKNYENHLIERLTKDLTEETIDEKREELREQMVRYLIQTEYFHSGRFWAYILGEVLNCVNVFVQIYIMNAFLGYKFLSFGLELLRFREWDSFVSYNPMMELFPRLTKCSFRRFGSSGDVQKHDAMCLLPVNILNEKIYALLWFWFFFLAIVSVYSIVYRVLTVFVPRVRLLATYSYRRMTNPRARKSFESVVNRCSSGTWFQMHLIYKNLNSMDFKDLIIAYDQAYNKND